jgi:Tol biopolymer transport system component
VIAPCRALSILPALSLALACDSTTDPFDGRDARPIVYFGLNEQTQWDLFRVDPAGGSSQSLGLPMTATLFPALSPDGSRLAFVVESDPAGVYVGNANGSNAQRVYAGVTTRITWSPDGTRLAIDDEGEILIVPLNGGSPFSITDNVDVYAGYPSWSSTGRIAFSSYDGFVTSSNIYTMAADGSDLRLIVEGEGFEARDPEWSPDGSHVAFAEGHFGESSIFILDADGRTRRRLTPPVPEEGWTELGPEWSPSGDWIAFQREHVMCEGQDCIPRYDVFIIPSGGGEARNLTLSHPWGGVRPTW